MRLVARSPDCCSSRYVLSLDGRPFGELSGRWFSQCLEVRLTDRRRWSFERHGWLRTEHRLTDAAGHTLATSRHAGLLSSAWDLDLADGPGQLVSAGLFNAGFHVERGPRRVGAVDRLGGCSSGWRIDADESLTPADLLLVGLTYHVILRRRRQSSAGAASS